MHLTDAKLDGIEESLPWSEYSTCDVLVFNPSDRRFYTIRDSEWVEVQAVPDELMPLLENLSLSPQASDEFVEQESVEYPISMCNDIRDILTSNPTVPSVETARETLHLLDSLLGNDRTDYSTSMEQFNIGEHGQGNNGRLPFADTEESDDDIDEILESIRSI